MPLWMLCYLGSCVAMYKLGRFTAQKPGRLFELGKALWKWISP